MSRGVIHYDRARATFAQAKLYARAATVLRAHREDALQRGVLASTAKVLLDKALMFRRMAHVASGRLGVA